MNVNDMNFTGKRIGKLKVIRKSDQKTKSGGSTWICKCDCGNSVILASTTIRSGCKRDCGCAKKEPLTTEKILHRTWQHMKERCNCPSCRSYKNYGARGITVCREWEQKDIGFKNFYDWAIQNGYEEGLSLDRIDNNKGYFPENCRWTTSIIQENNTRRNHRITFNGKTQTVAEWAREIGLPYNTLIGRLDSKGWTIEEALTIPKCSHRGERFEYKS